MSKQLIFDRWYAEWYDTIETGEEDVELFRELLKGQSRKIFEICCGTGRVLLPLARDGHELYGIDRNRFMISRLFSKAEDINNITIKLADAIQADWGTGYDAVIMGGNILINIENAATKEAYISAQKLFIKKSFDALKSGGLFIMDNDRHERPEDFFKTTHEPVIREIPPDSQGVSAEITYLWSEYDQRSQVCTGKNMIKLRDKDGCEQTQYSCYLKYIPCLEQQTQWVEDTGFEIINRWSDHQKSPIEKNSRRVIHWARKP